MRGYKFVRVFESGSEEGIPELDVAEAQRRAQDPLFLRNLAKSKGVKLDSTAPMPMKVVWALSDMEKYRGMRIDAIEVTPPH